MAESPADVSASLAVSLPTCRPTAASAIPNADAIALDVGCLKWTGVANGILGSVGRFPHPDYLWLSYSHGEAK